MRITRTGQFKKDFKRAKRQGRNVDDLRTVIEKLFKGEQLEARHEDHKLSGRWRKYRECHINPDWLLIYSIRTNELILERMGSHSELFQ